MNNKRVEEIQAEMAMLIDEIYKQSDGTQEKRVVSTIRKSMDQIIAREGGTTRPEFLGKRYLQLERYAFTGHPRVG